MYYFGLRWYNSSLALFTSMAPLPLDVEHNYGFCGSNPLYYTDATGQKPIGEAAETCDCPGGNCCDFVLCILNKLAGQPPDSGTSPRPGSLVCWNVRDMAQCTACLNGGRNFSGHIGIIDEDGNAISCGRPNPSSTKETSTDPPPHNHTGGKGNSWPRGPVFFPYPTTGAL